MVYSQDITNLDRIVIFMLYVSLRFLKKGAVIHHKYVY